MENKIPMTLAISYAMEKDIIYYQDFAAKCFNYLNGKINNLNIAAGLEISISNVGKYADTNGSKIQLYIVAVLNDYDDDALIKTFIIKIIAHELAHMDQVIDKSKYRLDPIYRKNIENQADYHSYMYLLNSDINHVCTEFKKDLIEFHLNELNKELYPPYKQMDLELYYLDKLYSICKDLSYIGKTLSPFNSIKLQLISLNGEDIEMLIKDNGEFYKDTFTFNVFMYKVNNITSDIYIKKITNPNGTKILNIKIKQLYKKTIEKKEGA